MELHSGQGSNFESEIFRNMGEKQGIRKPRTNRNQSTMNSVRGPDDCDTRHPK